MEIRIGVPVRAEDGEAGLVQRIILHPDTREFEGVVVSGNDMMGADVVVPAERVLGDAPDGLLVRGTLEELSQLDSFAASQYVEPPEDWIPPSGLPSSVYLFPASPYAVGAFTPPATQAPPPDHEVEDLAPGDIDVTGDTTVFCTDGPAGKVHRIITDGDSDRVSHLVVHRGGVANRDIAVPLDQVDGVDDEGVHLALSQDGLDRMPTFSG
jgi:hypothetical protein